MSAAGSGDDPKAAVARARRFLADAGAPLAGLAAEVLCGAASSRELVRALAAPEAGGLPALIPGSGPLEARAEALRLLDWADVLDGPVCEVAVEFLTRAQSPDGSWAEAHDADEPSRMERSGSVLAALARTPFARPSTLAAGEGWLRARWRVELVQGPSYGPVLAYLPVLANVPSEIADEALQWCGRELERGFRSGAFDPLATARVFLRCGARALPGTRLEAAEVVAALLRAQADDGGFGPAAPDASGAERAGATLEALVALLRLGA